MRTDWGRAGRVAAGYVAGWAVLVILWMLAFALQGPTAAVDWVDLFWRSALNQCATAIVAIPLIYLAWNRPFLGAAPYRAIPLYVLAIAAVTVARFALFVPLHNRFFGTTWSILQDTLQQFIPEFLALAGIVTLVWALRYYRDSQQREVEAVRLTGELAEARLRALQAQIHPHFLFNTLNGVSALMHRDVPKAEEMLARLCDLLRLTLYRTMGGEIPFSEELDILQRYADVMEMRFPARVKLRIDVPSELRQMLVPPLILQPLLENVLRHGVDEMGKAVEVRVSASKTDGLLTIRMADDGRGLADGGPPLLGIGLGNTQRRLHTVYGKGATLTIGSAAAAGTEVVITIPERAEV